MSTADIRDPAVVADVQIMLVRLGYRAGPADGIPGPRTRRAIGAFQRSAGLSQDGRVSEALLNQLREKLGEEEFVSRAKGAPPAHRAGTRFVYSDGRVFTIESAHGDVLVWRSNRGEEISGYRNFILPSLAWSDGRKHGRRKFDVEPGALWPLRRGTEIGFSARHVVNDSKSAEPRMVVGENWRCEVGESEEIAVVAGTFDTVKITCWLHSDDGSPDMTRTWYYAPLVEHYVRVNDFYDAVEQDRHVELVAIHPPREEWPPAARAGLNWAFQHALEAGKPGEEFPWTSSAVETDVTIAALRRYQRGDGKDCRNFVQTWTTPSSRSSYPGTACRSGSGIWFIPGLKGALDSAAR